MVFILVLLAVGITEASQYHNWGYGMKQHQVVIPSPNLNSNGKSMDNYGTARSYGSAPSGSGGHGNFNNFKMMSAPSSQYFKNPRLDKNVYNNYASGDVNSRYKSNILDMQRKSGNYNIPLSAPTNLRSYRNYGVHSGAYRPAGFYGNKTPSGFTFPQNFAQDFHGTRIYDGPRVVKNNPKKSGIYVIPTPSKLYFDGIKN
ncbi:uncharacterized protein LOC124353999 isoform X2 [Homalodisca vitripennis]|uniref:uncharacterized protein LOC124353999 isoform X2 n=1 Tax=Homalodisca vitripennis TaxID=197043 RepID=UPI001EEAB479|nr:uncharacterized protein LOC124353999 isoform X2 [Homalodisca vitripennis]